MHGEVLDVLSIAAAVDPPEHATDRIIVRLRDSLNGSTPVRTGLFFHKRLHEGLAVLKAPNIGSAWDAIKAINIRANVGGEAPAHRRAPALLTPLTPRSRPVGRWGGTPSPIPPLPPARAPATTRVHIQGQG